MMSFFVKDNSEWEDDYDDLFSEEDGYSFMDYYYGKQFIWIARK